MWNEMIVRAGDAATPQVPSSDAGQPFDTATWWSFATTVGPRTITVDCFVFHRPSASDVESPVDVREAGRQFATMLEGIDARPRAPH